MTSTTCCKSSACEQSSMDSPEQNNQTMPDVQASSDHRNVAIDKVGVKEVVYPMKLAQRGGGDQSTVATINMYVALPKEKKGTHMSRFLEVLNEHGCQAFSPSDIPAITRKIKERLNAQEAHFEASFTYFVEKPAPVTGQRGLMNYEVTFECTANCTEDFVIRVAAPATSLCPCSKEISEYGAHNQRCRIEAAVRTDGVLWIEDLIEHLEGAASHPVYAVLKRPDEKYVTEKAFENPKFVEDIIRDLAILLNNDDRIVQYDISSENFESIHSHNAYAELSRDKRLD
ncbi:MAG: GTP cyclohydrolase FolE2 [Phycisphaerales bacterium]|nr:GTP cyclohydrolase FolE2 [Phycisphaerales bacterium]